MKINKILFLIPLTTTILLSQTTGEDVFKKNCAVCHATILGITNDGGYDNSYITPAPYVSDLVKKLKKETGSKEKFAEFIKEYIDNPNKRKSLYGKRAIKKFGLMPSLKNAISDEEKSLLINYLYNEDYNLKDKPKVKEPKKIKKVDPREKLFTKNCATCHATILGVTNDGGYDNSYITPAPYVDNLVKKLKEETKTQEKFTEFIREYIENPDKRKSLYGKKAIKKFGLMPSLKGALTQDEIIQLANYLYEKH
jgi:mono/diheme cytochrome c family protein